MKQSRIYHTLTIVGPKDNVELKKLSKLKSDVVSLDLQSCGITEINGIEGFKNLKTINLSDNNITDITPLAKNTNLTTINLTKNVNIDENKENYTGDRLIALNKLAEIINNGGTINLDVDKLKLFNNYTSLDLSSQKLENLDALQGITGLTSLTLYNNKLTLQSESDQAILSQMKNLKTISLRRNANLANISFVNSLDNLTSLNIFECPLIKLKSIENKVSSLQMQLSNETLLSIFECDKSKITSLNLNTSGMSLSVEFPDLSDFTQLTYLKMSSQLSIPSFENISKISSLETLSLTNCSLHNRMISFNKLQNLKTLDLQNNSLWTEDLENLKALKNNTNISIDLRNNSIIDASALLELNQPAKIDLRNNVNLTQESKDALTAKFGNKVLY